MKKIGKILLFIVVVIIIAGLFLMSVNPTMLMDLRAKLTGKEVGEFDIANETEPFDETTFYNVYNDNVHRYWDSYEPYKNLITAAEAVGTKYVRVESGELDQGPSGIPIKIDMELVDIKAYAVDKDTFEDGLRTLNERYVTKFPQVSMESGIIP